MKPLSDLLPLLALALAGPPGAAADVTVLTVDNASLAAQSFTMGPDRRLQLALPDGTTRAIAAEDVVEIADAGEDRPAPAAPFRVTLTNGDVLVGAVEPSAGGDQLALASPSVGAVAVPLDQVDAIAVARNRRHLPAARPDTAGSDVLVRVGGDRVTGLLKNVTADTITFEVEGKGLPLPVRDVAGVYLARVKEPPAPPATLLATVSARDGTTLTGELSSASADGLRVRTLYPAAGGDAPRALTLPTTAFEFLYFRNGRCVYLSDLDPKTSEERDYFGKAADRSDPLAPPAWQRDRTVDPDVPGPLTLRKRVFRKGLGVHSYSALTWALDGKYKRFLCTIGVDDIGTGPEDIGGRVEFEVWVDGKKAFASGRATADDPPRDVDIAVEGAKELKLVVGFGEGFDILDRADWAGARLIR